MSNTTKNWGEEVPYYYDGAMAHYLLCIISYVILLHHLEGPAICTNCKIKTNYKWRLNRV